jgi:hypothetical protein
MKPVQNNTVNTATPTQSVSGPTGGSIASQLSSAQALSADGNPDDAIAGLKAEDAADEQAQAEINAEQLRHQIVQAAQQAEQKA